MQIVTPTDEKKLEKLHTVADALCEDCRALRALLHTLEHADDESMAEAYDKQVARARELRARVTAAVSLLDRRRREFRSEGRTLPSVVASHMEKACALLQEMTGAYEQVIGRVRCMMDSVRQDLLDLRKGRRAMRGYMRGGGRPAAGDVGG
jgi:16S rRNA C1402 (ribose-2'-O) methylase RsmI